MGWKKTEFMWENVKNLRNHLVGRLFHSETKPWETFHCALLGRFCGKSETFFKYWAQLNKPDLGQLEIFGRPEEVDTNPKEGWKKFTQSRSIILLFLLCNSWEEEKQGSKIKENCPSFLHNTLGKYLMWSEEQFPFKNLTLKIYLVTRTVFGL